VSSKKQKREKDGKFASDPSSPVPPVPSVPVLPLFDPYFAAKNRLADLTLMYEKAKELAPAHMGDPDLYVWSRVDDPAEKKDRDKARRLAAADVLAQRTLVRRIGSTLHEEAIIEHMYRYPDEYEMELALIAAKEAEAAAEAKEYSDMRERMRERLTLMVEKEEERFNELAGFTTEDRVQLAAVTENDDDFFILLRDREPEVRRALAGNPNCSDGDLDFVLARDPVQFVVDAALENVNATAYTWNTAKFSDRYPLAYYNFPPHPDDPEDEWAEKYDMDSDDM